MEFVTDKRELQEKVFKTLKEYLPNNQEEIIVIPFAFNGINCDVTIINKYMMYWASTCKDQTKIMNGKSPEETVEIDRLDIPGKRLYHEEVDLIAKKVLNDGG